MDKDYNEKEAVIALEVAREACLDNVNRPHITALVKGNDWESSVKLKKYEEPSCWRMVQKDENGLFEVIMHIQDIDAVYDVYALFARHVPGLKVLAAQGTKEQPMIEVSNRIFTPKSDAPSMNPVKVRKDVDENGFIERVNATDTIEEKLDQEGGKKTIRIPPQKLHVGDIVNVAFNMVAVGKPNEQKAILLLWNITLLDATHMQKWLKQKVKN
ncbi:hypothetical protein F5877DRAFT_73110 [Lentinula edodes]|nr:hypothetical protein F5877DRAFT_73110 [Lentinula edodes]